MKSSLVFAAVLLFASAAHAQIASRPVPVCNSAGLNYYGQIGWGSGGAWSGINTPIGRPVRYEEPREYEIGYAVNDGPFVSSTYMNYDDAVAFGRKQLAETAQHSSADANPGFSLGQAARAYRIVKVPTMRLRSRVLQDNSGSGGLQICNLNGNDCHRL